MNEEYLSVEEFAAAANVSQQAIYKQIKGRLEPYVEYIQGKRMIKKEAINIFYGNNSTDIKPDATEVKPETTENKPDATENKQETTDEVEQPLNPKSTQEGSNTDNVSLLREIIEKQEKQLEEKQKTIDTLLVSLNKAQDSNNKLQILVDQQQHLAAHLITQKPVEAEEETIYQSAKEVDTPAAAADPEKKKGFFARLFK